MWTLMIIWIATLYGLWTCGSTVRTGLETGEIRPNAVIKMDWNQIIRRDSRPTLFWTWIALSALTAILCAGFLFKLSFVLWLALS